ncbi:hypothetical protein ScPMuIL_017711 [Solemya velum]
MRGSTSQPQRVQNERVEIEEFRLFTNMAASMRRVANVIPKQILKCSLPIRLRPSVRSAKKVGGGKMGAPVQKVELQVEEDPVKLCNFLCGGNFRLEGPDPEIKPDAEYPDWLWSLRTERTPPDLSELDQDDFYYWRRLRKSALKHNNQLMKVRKIK